MLFIFLPKFLFLNNLFVEVQCRYRKVDKSWVYSSMNWKSKSEWAHLMTSEIKEENTASSSLSYVCEVIGHLLLWSACLSLRLVFQLYVLSFHDWFVGLYVSWKGICFDYKYCNRLLHFFFWLFSQWCPLIIRSF